MIVESASVGTACYAMFHCLAGTAADLLIGRTRGPAWHRGYRVLEHGRAGNAVGGSPAHGVGNKWNCPVL